MPSNARGLKGAATKAVSFTARGRDIGTCTGPRTGKAFPNCIFSARSPQGGGLRGRMGGSSSSSAVALGLCCGPAILGMDGAMAKCGVRPGESCRFGVGTIPPSKASTDVTAVASNRVFVEGKGSRMRGLAFAGGRTAFGLTGNRCMSVDYLPAK